MSIRHLISKVYQETVAFADVPEELKQSLKSNERVPAMIHNLETEFGKMPLRLQTRENIEETVRDMTGIFLSNLERLASERHLSDCAKAAMLATQDKQTKQDKIVKDIEDGKEIDAERIVEII